jgi:hypothetical protein
MKKILLAMTVLLGSLFNILANDEYTATTEYTQTIRGTVTDGVTGFPLTGAFPAEYGNATAGAFDLDLRSGNNRKTEFSGQIGFNGFEAGVEGPFLRSRQQENRLSFSTQFRQKINARNH